MLHGDSSRKGCLAGCGTACSGLLKQIFSSSDCQSTNTVEPQLMWHVRAVTWRDLVLFCPMCLACLVHPELGELSMPRWDVGC